MASTLYYVQRHDFSHHTDQTGRKELLSVHATLQGANDEASDQLQEIKENEDDKGLAVIEEDGVGRDGCYTGVVRLFQDDTDEGIDTCVITVKTTILHGGFVQVSDQPPRKRRRRNDDYDTEEDEEEPTESGDEQDEDSEHYDTQGPGSAQHPIEL